MLFCYLAQYGIDLETWYLAHFERNLERLNFSIKFYIFFLNSYVKMEVKYRLLFSRRLINLKLLCKSCSKGSYIIAQPLCSDIYFAQLELSAWTKYFWVKTIIVKPDFFFFVWPCFEFSVLDSHQEETRHWLHCKFTTT